MSEFDSTAKTARGALIGILDSMANILFVRTLTILFGSVLMITSCGKSDEPKRINDSSKRARVLKKLDNAEVPNKFLTLENDHSKSEENDSLSGNLFGRFFCDRAEFYIIDNPQNQIYQQQPSSITLYYLDGELCQTKYELNGDISNALFKELGRCRIKGFDERNKQIIESKEVRIKSQSDMLFNPFLDNYELRWIIGETEIKYRVEKKEKEVKFIYIEKLRRYEKLYNRIEKYC